ncbi:methionyl-tRNA formyltransferase [Rickettsiales bacterium LUAb2]
MNICFMGSPLFAATILQNLLNNKYNITAVYTKAPASKNRGLKITRSPVHDLALTNNIKVYHPINFKNQIDVEEFTKQNFDLAIVAAYGLLLPLTILNAPKLGCINIHASLLPKWRGAAPIERSIAAGDHETGITIMQMEKGLDTGDMLNIGTIAITDQTTAKDLYQDLANLGSKLINQTLQQLSNNHNLSKTPQNHNLATYAKKLNKEEGKIDFNEESAIIERKIRAFNIFPSSYFIYNGELIKVHKAKISNNSFSFSPGTIINNHNCLVISTGNNTSIELEILQRSGKKALPIIEFLKGFNFQINDIIQ